MERRGGGRWLCCWLLIACLASCRTAEAPDAEAAPAASADLAAPVTADAEADCTVIVDAEPQFGDPPLTVRFESEVDCTASPVTYTWEFGDGGPGSHRANPSHTYEKAGTFIAVVKVAAPDGTASDDSIEISVDPARAGR